MLKTPPSDNIAPGQALTVRPARLEDLARIDELERLVWRELAASYEELKRRFRSFPQGLLVAAAGSEVLGFCCGILTDQDATLAPLDESFPPRHTPKGAYFFVYGLTVDPVFRKRGVGRCLGAEEVRVATRQGCKAVQLVANQFSRPLFEGLGLKVVRPVTELFAAHRELMPDPVLMETRLDGANESHQSHQ